ncbi:Complex I intermediate-associated protein 30 [Penicillium macrosclerotiorum]|uniref:Complex I intermediate-associated protein 30 n=1 Tax=Penicillium macrosclerotiorum TaxID=303699 RepID=UPI0025492382|nr:Complex I intermediate-associated protein 30 [Penicillium macrosclerotiorum]KAJ5692166.1 Complex I intermediate-associated protein 30 [Penicillium macrosclerotiorum]
MQKHGGSTANLDTWGIVRQNSRVAAILSRRIKSRASRHLGSRHGPLEFLPKRPQLFASPPPQFAHIQAAEIYDDSNSELGCTGRVLPAQRGGAWPPLENRYTWNTEALHTPTKPYVLLNFEDESTVGGCKTFADRAVGGFSTSSLDYEPGDSSTNTPAHARFHGSISTKLPANWRVERTGYAAFRNNDRGFWLFGRLFWDVDPYSYLALRIKSDGRRYTTLYSPPSCPWRDPLQQALRSESAEDSEVTEELYPRGIPAALSDFPPESTIISSSSTATTSGTTGWETVLLPFNSFVRTNHGYVIEPQTSLLRSRVKSIGIGLTDRIEGPYDLRIHKIWATNGMGSADIEEERRICGADALPLDEGVQSAWTEKKQPPQEAHNQKSPETTKEKGLKGLRSEWEE